MAEVTARLVGFSAIDYDRKPIRKALRIEGTEVRNIARKFVSTRGVSSNGDDPGLRTGLLRRSIRSTVLRGGLAVSVEPTRKVLEAKRDYEDAAYPWILDAGVKGTKLGRRRDYLRAALGRREAAATANLTIALERALVPRK